MDRITGKSFATRSEVIARNGMAATAHPLATQVAIDVLKKGGSAVDAAIAANACLGLMEPVGCGLGGDLFAIVWDAKTEMLHGINGSGCSPKGLSYDQMKVELTRLGTKTIPKFGVLPISVPGAVDAWFELHDRFGKLPMSDDLAPAIQYAIEGFPVTELIAYSLARDLSLLANQPGALFETYTINGKPPAKGDIFRNCDLANTYHIIAEKGRDAFYKGEIAEKIDQFFRANGCYLRQEDFASHRSDWVSPVSVNYRGYEVYEILSNTQGATVLQMLNIIEGFDIKSMEFGTADVLHMMIEAKKLAYEDRARLYSDSSFYNGPTAGLLSKEYAAECRNLIDLKKATLHYDAGVATLSQGDTTYLCVADKDGNMISLIQSNFRGMGCGIVVPGLGFGFQDRGELFSMEPGHPNVYGPGKRPFHTIIPGFVMKEGKPWLAFGVMGGDMQPMGQVQILTNIIDFSMNLQEAGDAPRWQHEGSSTPIGEVMNDGGWVNVETGYPYQSIRELINRGHRVRYDLGAYGGYQAIMRDERQGVYYGASESRKDGCAIGF